MPSRKIFRKPSRAKVEKAAKFEALRIHMPKRVKPGERPAVDTLMRRLGHE